jgi:F-type H+-transporting ATPase subunit epsilon
MAKASFEVSIVTPERTSFDGMATSLTLPAADGYLGVWAHHAPMVAAMRPGVVTVETAPGGEGGVQEKHYAVGFGFAEVKDNRAILLVDSCEFQDQIDLERAKAALQRGKERLRAALHDKSIDLERAEAACERAAARLKAAYLRGA